MQVTDTAWKTHSPGSGEASLNFTIGYLWESVSSSLSYEELTRCMIIVSHHTLIKQCGMTFVRVLTSAYRGRLPAPSQLSLIEDFPNQGFKKFHFISFNGKKNPNSITCSNFLPIQWPEIVF